MRDERHAFIAARIRLARQEAQETQAELARAIGSTQDFVSGIERGFLYVRALDLERIATHYGKPFGFFFPDTTALAVEPEPTDALRRLIAQLPMGHRVFIQQAIELYVQKNLHKRRGGKKQGTHGKKR